MSVVLVLRASAMALPPSGPRLFEEASTYAMYQTTSQRITHENGQLHSYQSYLQPMLQTQTRIAPQQNKQGVYDVDEAAAMPTQQ